MMMGWFSKKPPTTIKYSVTSLQVGDECACVDDRPHDRYHQKLLEKGRAYKVRDVSIAKSASEATPGGWGGPWIRVEGVIPIHDAAWACARFEKVVKKPAAEKVSVVEAVLRPVKAGELDVEKEKAEAY